MEDRVRQLEDTVAGLQTVISDLQQTLLRNQNHTLRALEAFQGLIHRLTLQTTAAEALAEEYPEFDKLRMMILTEDGGPEMVEFHEANLSELLRKISAGEAEEDK